MEIASVGLTGAQVREQYSDSVAMGMFPWSANARAVMRNETAGWVKSIHETRNGQLLGLVIETVVDGVAPEAQRPLPPR